MEPINTRLGKLESEITILKTDVSTLQTDVTKVRRIIENELTRNIKVIAESHQDNNRHARAAENVAGEVKDSQIDYEIRLNILENQVNELKKVVGM